MTTKQKFTCENPRVEVLKNGRFAYKELCPWKGKGGKDLYAWKFCSRGAYDVWMQSQEPEMQSKEPEELTSEAVESEEEEV